MSKLFVRVYNFFHTRQQLLFLIFFSLLFLMGLYASRIRFSESVLQMLPENAQSEQMAAFLGNSKFSDRIVVAISQKDSTLPADPEKLIALTDTFVTKLQQQLPEYISGINYRTDDSTSTRLTEIIRTHLPVFLEENDYRTIDSLISDESIRNTVENNYKLLTGPGGIALKKFILEDPLGLTFIGLKKLGSYQADERLELYDGYYLTKDHQNLLLVINPALPSSETAKNSVFFEGVDRIISSLETKDTGIIYFGAPAVAAGNAAQIRQDSILTVSITVILLLIIIVLFFRNAFTPLMIITPVVFGALFALTLIYFIQGTISVIAVGSGSLVLGIAVNYSMHFLTHYRYHPDIRATIRELAFPMTAGSLTTIGGFLCLRFVQAPVLQDLGLFAALSLAGAAIASLVFLPHFIGLQKNKSVKAPALPGKLFSGITIPGGRFRLWMIVLLTPLFLYFAKDVAFETDLYKINYMPVSLKNAEVRMNSITSFYQKSVFVLTNGSTLENSLEENEKIMPVLRDLKEKGTVISYASPSTLLPSEKEQQRRIKKWNDYWQNNNSKGIYEKLVSEGARFNFKETAFTPFLTQTSTVHSKLSSEDQSTLRNSILDNYLEEKPGEWTLVNMVKINPGSESEIYGALGNFPATHAFDRQYVTDRLMEMVNADFNFITLWTSALVFFALLLIYGRIELTLITFIPMLVSWIWILGLMSLLNIHFNIVNIVLSTFIFALGDDFCIFTTDGLQQDYARRSGNLKSLRVSIALSAITTIIGMGVLILAKHPALSSIALISIIGISSVWFISQTLQPVLFRFLITKPASKKHEPYTFFNILKSIFAFSYFIFGSLLISLIGIIFKVIPFNSAKKKLLYHNILKRFAFSMIYIMTNVKKKIINNYNEDFSKPAVIIANHTSFLDILLLIMLHPKLILLTNKWVWNSPVFGIAVRMAEYYPVQEGADNTIPQLSGKVAEGYSIVVFPEGTRSVDGTIGRFHKGAFYLAENLNLDILPIVIHGAAHTMTKGFFYLKNGQLTLNILKRIKPDDTSFGVTYQERSKKIRRYFIEQLELLGYKVGTPQYYRGQLISNYIFKGPVLEWYMKVKLKLENNYKFFNNLVPRKGNILDIGCGYGFLDYMLHYTSSDRNIVGVDYDEEKITIAKNCYDKNESLQFHHADALGYEFPGQDAIILSDVLHYLPETGQVNLLEKCMSRLNQGGIIIIRDGIRELSKRHFGTRLSEFFSTRLLGFNKTGSEGLTFISSQLIEDVAHRHRFAVTVTDNTRFTSNVIFVLQKST